MSRPQLLDADDLARLARVQRIAELFAARLGRARKPLTWRTIRRALAAARREAEADA